MRVEITIPADIAPLTLNKQLHWAAKAKLSKAWRHAAYTTVTEAWPEDGLPRPRFAKPVFMVVLVSFPDKRRRDPHNWTPTFKACIDGFVDAGLLVDDSAGYLTGPLPILDDTTKGSTTLTFVLTDEIDIVALVSAPDEAVEYSIETAAPWSGQWA